MALQPSDSVHEIDVFGSYAACGAGALVGALLLRRGLAPDPAAGEAIRDTRLAFVLLALGLLHPIFVPAPRPAWSAALIAIGATGFVLMLVWTGAQLVGRPMRRGGLWFALAMLSALFMGLTPLGLDAISDALSYMLLVGVSLLAWVCRPLILAPRDVHERLYGTAVASMVPVHVMRAMYSFTMPDPAPEHLLHMPAELRTPMGLLYAVLPLLNTLLMFNLLNARHQAQLRTGMMTDQLTGALSRHALASGVERLRASAAAGGERLAVILSDVDHFKRINDLHGHAVGDAVLRLFAQRMTTALRADAIFVRLGGEEFVAVVTVPDLPGARAVAERLREAASHGSGELPPITASFGVVLMASGQSIESALSLADEALYRAKRAGRDQVAMGIAAA